MTKAARTTVAPEKMDGRVLRRNATKAKLTRAARDLINETGRPAHALDTAKRAGVSLRTVYHHFPDVETLTREALALHPRKRLTIVIEPAEKAS